MSKTDKPREGGVEALRVVLMLFIIGHHVMVHGAGLFNAAAMDAPSWIRLALNSFFVIAVDTFVLISGYFTIKLKSGGLFRLLSMAWFYAIVIGVSFMIAGLLPNWMPFGADRIYEMFMPVSTNLWWFVSNFVLLMIISPILNRLAQELAPKAFAFMMLAFFFLECVMGYGFGVQGFWGNGGYSVYNFALIYLIGAGIKRFHTMLPKMVYLGIFLVSSAIIFTIAAILINTGNAGYVFSRAFGYNSPLLILSAASLFLFFKNLNIQRGPFIALSPFVLGVYLVHDHPFIRNLLYKQILNVPEHANSLLFFAFLPLWIALIFLAGTLIEYIRTLLTKKLEDKIIGSTLFKSIDEVLVRFQAPAGDATKPSPKS